MSRKRLCQETLAERVGAIGKEPCENSKPSIQLSHESIGSVFSSQRVVEIARQTLPEVIGLFSDRFLISLLSLIFLVKMADPDDAGSICTEPGLLRRRSSALHRHYGRDWRHQPASRKTPGGQTSVEHQAPCGYRFPLSVDSPSRQSPLMAPQLRATVPSQQSFPRARLNPTS